MKSISFILGLAVTGCLVLPAPARADAPERVDSREVGKIADDEDAKRVCPRVCAPPARWNGKWRPKRGGAFVCDCVVSGQPEAAAPEHHDGPPARRRRGAVANDVDGDGKADLVLQYDHKGKRRWQARRSTGEAFGYNKDWTDTSTPGVEVVAVADVNGDKRADLVLQYDHQGKRRWQARLSTGEAFAFNGDWSDTSTPDVTAVGVADVDGDGKGDLVLQYDHQGKRRWQARLSTGTAFAFNGDWTDTSTPDVTAVGLADANGDGKADLWLQYDHEGKRRWQARLSTGTAFAFNGDWTDTSTPDVRAVGLADVNGDGMADLVLQYDHKGKRRWQARRSTGSAFGYNKDWTDTTTPGVEVVGLADVDGDGMADLVLSYDHQGKRRWQARRSTGEAFGYNKDWTDTSTPDVVAFDLFDADGDGRADLVLQYDHEGKRRWQVRRSTGTAFAHNGDWSDTTTPAVKPVGAAWRQVANGRR